MSKVWNIKKYDEKKVEEIMNKYNVSKTLAKLKQYG